MSVTELLPFLPFEILGAASILALLASAFLRRTAAAFTVTIVGLAAALASVWFVWPMAPVNIRGFLQLDRFALFATALTIGATLITAMTSLGRLRERDDERGEFFSLLILSCLGASVLAAAASFASLFLGLELLSVTLFVLIAYRRERPRAASAGVMYMILAGVSSAFLLFGMALIYAGLGSMSLREVAVLAASGDGGLPVLAGLGLITVGVGFKLAVVPFHFWTPDIYDGAASPVAGFVATASKGAMAVLLVRFIAPVGIGALGGFLWVFPVVSAVTMFVGNILALREENVKRILAYSSIAHLGYLLIAFVAGGREAVLSTAFFLAAYYASTLCAFSAVSARGRGSGADASDEADMLEDYRGLARRSPLLSACLTVALLSLAGIPLTAGFMGKLILFVAGGGAFQWVLIALLAVNSTISLFYYLKIISAMYGVPREEAAVLTGATGVEPAAPPTPDAVSAAGPRASGIRLMVPFFTGLSVAITAAGILILGMYPGPLMDLIGSFLP